MQLEYVCDLLQTEGTVKLELFTEHHERLQIELLVLLLYLREVPDLDVRQPLGIKIENGTHPNNFLCLWYLCVAA
jgi:hypothetical protein